MLEFIGLIIVIYVIGAAIAGIITAKRHKKL